MNVEQKALELVNAVCRKNEIACFSQFRRDASPEAEALCRAIIAHEADKSRHAAELASTRRLADEWRSDALASQSRHAAEMREQAERFSEALTSWFKLYSGDIPAPFRPFILAPVDPLAELAKRYGMNEAELREHFDERGLAIVKKEAV